MKITNFKPVSIYTHPAITAYEFDRMRGVERLWKIMALAWVAFICIAIGLILGNSKPPVVRAPVVVKPVAHKTLATRYYTSGTVKNQCEKEYYKVNNGDTLGLTSGEEMVGCKW